ncbi:MAG: hypothetical protein GF418_12600 [Chitinivibrionales bacterium]|nr:hypothetical protein [Chitinivibrionales bacterium]MBD3396459.1 hypothetical protein [Chitinivibrionales bacterium]
MLRTACLKAFVLCMCLRATGIATGADRDALSGATSRGAVSLAVENFVFEHYIKDGRLHGTLSYPTKGWIAVGFKPVKRMKDANIIMGYADGDDFVVSDQFGTGTTSHKPDSAIGGTDDVLQGSCSEKNGVTSMWFVIPLDSGDEKDRKLTPGETVPVIFAAGKKDSFHFKHGKVASKKITLQDVNERTADE